MSKMMNNIICVKWGDKYDDSYVEKLKEQCEKNCSVDFNFYCYTDKPIREYDIKLDRHLDRHYNPQTNFFWAWRKCYLFDDPPPYDVQGDNFLFLDLDVIIHQDLKYFFELPMDKPWIVRGWWNDMETVKRNYARYRSTPLNSSVIRWNRGQLKPLIKHVEKFSEVIFFTYPSLDNYLAHHWYDPWNEEESFFRGFPQGDIYSWFKGNVFPDDMETGVLRKDHKICLFNNSGFSEGLNTKEIEEQW